MITITKPFLPPLQEYEAYLADIWQRGWVANNGPLVVELETKIKHYLDSPAMLFVNNGTMALQVAIKALGLQGEIITTPFSFIATTSSVLWEKCKPVYADIDPFTFNIDPAKIEALITPATTAILATHVFGNPCDIEAIDDIAKRYGLKVIYDASHCFGVKYKGKSIYAYGDISTASFHASKLYHTIEGGGIFSGNTALLNQIAFIRNFGFNGPEHFACTGINAKNSELHAAMGLVNLRYVNDILLKRRQLYEYYLDCFDGYNVQLQQVSGDAQYNYGYFPVVFQSEQVVKKVLEFLNSNDIYPRRYFYPSLNTLDFVDKQSCPNSLHISQCILCLPMYYGLTHKDIDSIVNIIKSSQALYKKNLPVYNLADYIEKFNLPAGKRS
ncbi:MAG TPA: DegT/DnrJ/EryC1/StrS family aminotransferase [Chitinophagaceae bacterium]|nr:DegT/DnrJ/EryC1/StrS family aminotransferase [Chitinophagaceae bacterium]